MSNFIQIRRVLFEAIRYKHTILPLYNISIDNRRSHLQINLGKRNLTLKSTCVAVNRSATSLNVTILSEHLRLREILQRQRETFMKTIKVTEVNTPLLIFTLPLKIGDLRLKHGCKERWIIIL